MMNIFVTNNKKSVPVWTLKGHSDSNIGKVRKNNEDSVFFKLIPGSCVAIVADGMGGHAGGEVASKIAVDTIVENLPGDPKRFNENVLKSALGKANKKILATANKNSSLKGMGCTATIIASWNNSIFWAHVGDSRFYLRHDSNFEQITSDHSLDNLGGTNEGQSHILIRAMGLYKDVEIDSGTIMLKDELSYRALLCSDGLYDMLNDDEIKDILKIDSPYLATNCLIAMSNLKGGHDNISVIVIDFRKNDVRNSNNITKEIKLP